MLIDNNKSSINDFLNKDNYKNIGVQLYLTLKDNKKDEYYFSKEVNLSVPAKNFLKTHIIECLQKEKSKNSGNFNLDPYDTEYVKVDALAYYDYKDKEYTDEIKSRVELLTGSFENQTLDNFLKGKLQIVRLNIKKNVFYFCFYRGTKKMTEYKKLGVLSPNGLVISEENYIEIGGNFAFFWDQSNLYISNVVAFENVFDFKDHISRKSTDILNEIVSKDFFIDEAVKQRFLKKSSNAVYSRGLAKLDNNVLGNIETLFKERTMELKVMYKNREKLSGNEKAKYISKIGKLNELINYFDFEKEKLVIEEEDSPTVLLHFFQNKIAQTFLTKEFVVL